MIENSMRLSDWNDMDWQYLQGLSKSIECIPSIYIWDKKNKKYHMERIFSYELYHQWSRTLRRKDWNPEKLVINAELSKHYDEFSNVKFPDMVLHGDISNTNKQYIICEIKSSRNYIPADALEKDIISLLSGMNKIGYHCGVFIYLGGAKSHITKRLRKIVIDLKIDYSYNNKIIVAKVVNYKKIYYELL